MELAIMLILSILSGSVVGTLLALWVAKWLGITK